MHFPQKVPGCSQKEASKIMHVSRECKWGRGKGSWRSGRRILLYKKRLVYAAHRGCGSALVVQVAYLIFIRSLFLLVCPPLLPPFSSFFHFRILCFASLACIAFSATFASQSRKNFLIHTYCCCPQRQHKKRDFASRLP